MARATFYNKRLLGHIDDIDFTDYQGIGSDPLYKRYKSVESVVKSRILPQYQSFLSCPFYEDGSIFWYVDEWNDAPQKFTELSGLEKDRYTSIKAETIKHYQETLKKLNPEEFSILNGALKYINDEFIYCYDGKVVLIAWGMRLDDSKHTSEGKWFKTAVRYDKKKISFDLAGHGKLSMSKAGIPYLTVINRDKGHVITTRDIPSIIADEGFSFVGWIPNPIGHEVLDDIIFTAQYSTLKAVTPTKEEKEELVKIIFDAGKNGILKGESSIEVPQGHILSIEETPSIVVNKGFKFTQWSPSINEPINKDTLFTAEYKQESIQCNFSAGEHGTLQGNKVIRKPFGAAPLVSEIPIVKPNKGYRFTGWDVDPFAALTNNKVCVAQYEKILPWYKRWRLWTTGFFSGKGCLKWLLWLLLIILLIWLLSWLLRGCDGDVLVDRNGNAVLPNDKADKIEQVAKPDGTIHDNNGSINNIVGSDGRLPENGVVSPIIGNDGIMPPIVSNPGTPDIIENRLNIYFEDKNADLNKWVQDFKQIYPSDSYQVIGYDPNVRMIQIQIPEGQRDNIREELPLKISDQKFFIVDESIMVLHGNKSQSTGNKGWHLKATHVKEGWDITKGDPNLVVAIIDDGIDVNHSMFKDRFFKAYNVFTQNRALSPGQGHGTHVAGLAVGSTEFYSEGAAGVAPNCKIMPVQVFDNGMCTFSSLASGIMYAIHNGANIVNISIGPSFQGLSQLPIEEQIKVAQQYFKNEEKVYKHIINTANEKNVILVFAAGNDNIVTAILPECRLTNNTINVAACTHEYKSSVFTNYSLGTNVSAPGEGIYSAYPTNSFKMFDGTSMAAPIISGTIALMKTIKPDINVKQCIAVIQKTGKDLDKFIPPMILIDKVLTAVKNGDIPEEPIWTQILDTGSIEHNDEIAPTDQSPNKEQNSTVIKNPTDDYSALKDLLKQLKEQRDALNKKINDLEKKFQ